MFTPDSVPILQPPIDDKGLARSVDAAAIRLGDDIAAGASVNEDRLRERLCSALAENTTANIERERHVDVPGFQGVGPVDVVIRDHATGVLSGLVECKWSVDAKRDKIYEGAWDAIKLALAVSQCDTAGWLVTGAPAASWEVTETPDLFADGNIKSAALWRRKLYVRGPNGGASVGSDCEAGGRGNMFTYAPERLRVRRVADVAVPGSDVRIRAARIAKGIGPMIRFAEDPEFPARTGQRWLETHVPAMADDEFDRLLVRLRAKRWTETDIDTRIRPLRNVSQL